MFRLPRELEVTERTPLVSELRSRMYAVTVTDATEGAQPPPANRHSHLPLPPNGRHARNRPTYTAPQFVVTPCRLS